MTTNKTKNCDCKEWEKSFKYIIAAQLWAEINDCKYKGYPFIYCPWCGKKLELNNAK